MICTRCKEDLSPDNFKEDKKSKSGLSCYCKTCQEDYSREYYLKNRQKIIERTKNSNKRIRKKIRQYIIDYLRSHPCTDCGEDDIVVLEFDHQQDKRYNITELLRNTSFQKLKKEIDKCEVRCANCHRRKTAKDFKWYKLEE